MEDGAHPSFNIISPDPGAVFSIGDEILIHANVSDPDLDLFSAEVSINGETVDQLHFSTVNDEVEILLNGTPTSVSGQLEPIFTYIVLTEDLVPAGSEFAQIRFQAHDEQGNFTTESRTIQIQ